MNKQNALEYAYNELSLRAARAHEMAQKLQSEQYEKYPELRALDDGIGNAASAMMKKVLEGSAPRSEIARVVDRAIKDRDAYMKKNDIKPIPDTHFCKRCADTGKNGDAVCACVGRLVRDYRARKIIEQTSLELCGFESFCLDYYPKLKTECGTPYNIMKSNFAVCKGFASSAPNTPQSLLLAGEPGLGKTHLALSIAKQLIENDCDVIYCSAPSIFKLIEREYRESSSTDTLDSLKECEVLILDDLGAEYVTPFLVSALYDLVNTRINTGRSTVYTTNVTNPELLKTRYGDSVASRLIGSCRVLAFIGDDVRQVLKSKNNV